MGFPGTLAEAARWREEFLGVVVLRAEAAATFYMPHTERAERRAAIAEVGDAFLARWAGQLRWCRHPRTLRWNPASRCKPPSTWLPAWDPRQAWQFEHHAGQDARDASPVRLYGFGAYAWQGGDGYLSLVTPLAELLADPDAYCRDVLAWAERLQPEHGHAGPALASSPEIEFEQYAQPLVWELARRHVGLDVNCPLEILYYLHQGIKSACWLTVLSDEWAARCPGLAALGPDSAVQLLRYPGGVVVRAGRLPELGGPLGELGPPAYREAARLLRPVMAPAMGSFHFAGPNRMHDQEVRAWRARFDG